MTNRPSYDQLEGLVEFLEQNPGVAKGLLRTAQGKLETKRKWENLATTLNSLGGAIKNGQGWAKYWIEKKHGLKKQCAQLSASMRRTGGGMADNLPQLSALENRLVAVMGGQEFASGDPTLIVNPFPQTTRPTESPVVMEDSYIMPVEIEIHGNQISPIPDTPHNDALPASSTTKLLTTLVLLNVALAAEPPKKNASEDPTFHYFGPDVDPNELSCDPSGHIFLLLPHFTDCSKFYMCAHGEEVEFSCPGGLIFDFQLQVCNWVWATTCQLRTPRDEDEGSGDEADSLIGFFSDELEQQPVDTVASVRPISPEHGKYNSILNCARADNAARQVPYKGDCQRFWRCVAGVPQVAFCTDGLFFNDQTQQCDFEANSKCVLAQEDELQSEFIKYEQ